MVSGVRGIAGDGEKKIRGVTAGKERGGLAQKLVSKMWGSHRVWFSSPTFSGEMCKTGKEPGPRWYPFSEGFTPA